jgi:glycosyltransferase involved in cell wall biosynthesis
MLVGESGTADPTVKQAASGRVAKGKAIFWPFLDSLSPRRYPNRINAPFSAACFAYGEKAVRSIDYSHYDVVCLYWITGAFLRPESLKVIPVPIVWRLSDMWAFTGGCHYSGGCTRYQAQCGACPLLGSKKSRDISHSLWRRKRRAWNGIDITVVSPSRWLAEAARSSALFCDCRIEVIPTGVDLHIYQPLDALLARRLLNLPLDRRLVLFGASSPRDDVRKGFSVMKHVLAELALRQSTAGIHAVVVGVQGAAAENDLPVPASYLGKLHDDAALNLAYAAADVVVVPSLEDNLPNVALEAFAAGTPVVAFASGGMGDIVDDGSNGCLVAPGNAGMFARAIEWVLSDPVRARILGESARRKAETKFSLAAQTEFYRRLFMELTDRKKSSRFVA